MKEYRIMEFDGKFMIQIKEEKNVGLLWWRKKKVEWHRTDINGIQLMYFPQLRIDTAVYPGIQPLFTNIEDARKKIKSWMEGQKIHSA